MTRTEVENMLGFDPYPALERYQKAIEARAKLRAEIEFKKEYIKTALALATENVRYDGTSEKRLETLARASQEYRDFLNQYHKDWIEYSKLDAEYLSSKAKFEFEQNMNYLEQSRLKFER